MRLALFMYFFSQLSLTGLAQFEKNQLITSSDTLPYQLLKPINYDDSETYPLVLFLHGAGERGSDNELQMLHGSSLFTDSANRKKYPAFVVFPQCPDGEYWSNMTFDYEEGYGMKNIEWKEDWSDPMNLVIRLLAELKREYRINEEQVYVMGLSMGGFGTFDLLSKRGQLFAAGIPICAGANPMRFSHLLSTPLWVFHGANDRVVPVALSQSVVTYLDKEKADVKYTEYEGVGHASWENTFAEKNLLRWLFKQRRNE